MLTNSMVPYKILTLTLYLHFTLIQGVTDAIFQAVSEDAHLIHLQWSPTIKPGFSISYRENDGNTWVSLAPILPNEGSDRNIHKFRRRDPCAKYEFRLQGWAADSLELNTDPREVKIQRTVFPKIPQRIEAMIPQLHANYYNSTKDEVQVLVSWSVEAYYRGLETEWPIRKLETRAAVHVVSCDHDGIIPVPEARRVNTTTFQVDFPRPYFEKIIETGHSCQALFIFEPIAIICEESIQVKDNLDTNSALMEIGCATTINLPCSYAAQQASVPKPNCNPNSVTTQRLPNKSGILVRWDFGATPLDTRKSSDASRDILPKSIRIRYGLTQPQPDNQVLFGFVPITQELGREEVSGERAGSVILLQPVAGDKYRISICATYGGNPHINWEIAPNYPIVFAKRKEPTADGFPGALPSTFPPLTTPPTHELCEEAGSKGGENFNWRPVALTVGLFSLANLVLLFMSCFLYSRARKQQLIAQKTTHILGNSA